MHLKNTSIKSKSKIFRQILLRGNCEGETEVPGPKSLTKETKNIFKSEALSRMKAHKNSFTLAKRMRGRKNM